VAAVVNERDALLAAIDAAPADDTVRLAYADWLDESGDRPADGPTAEFVRLSCDMTPAKPRQTYAEGKWLRNNWERLVPSLVARGVHFVRREGRWVHAQAIDRVCRGGRTEVRRWVELEFWRGLVRAVRFTSASHALELLPHLLADQPLVQPALASLKFAEEYDDEGAYTLVECWELGAASGALRGFDATTGEGYAAVFRPRPGEFGAGVARQRAADEVRAALLRKAWALHDEHRREREGALA
jgi:uncharacterized protein (TIGR02996 family)